MSEPLSLEELLELERLLLFLEAHERQFKVDDRILVNLHRRRIEEATITTINRAHERRMTRF